MLCCFYAGCNFWTWMMLLRLVSFIPCLCHCTWLMLCISRTHVRGSGGFSLGPGSSAACAAGSRCCCGHGIGCGRRSRRILPLARTATSWGFYGAEPPSQNLIASSVQCGRFEEIPIACRWRLSNHSFPAMQPPLLRRFLLSLRPSIINDVWALQLRFDGVGNPCQLNATVLSPTASELSEVVRIWSKVIIKC